MFGQHSGSMVTPSLVQSVWVQLVRFRELAISTEEVVGSDDGKWATERQNEIEERETRAPRRRVRLPRLAVEEKLNVLRVLIMSVGQALCKALSSGLPSFTVLVKPMIHVVKDKHHEKSGAGSNQHSS